MNILQRVGSALQTVGAPAAKTPAEPATYNFLTCAGFLLVIGFAAFTTWILKGVLNTETIALLAHIVTTFLYIYGGLTALKYVCNTLVRIDRQRLSFKDGTLSDVEERALESADRSGDAPVIPPRTTGSAAGAPPA